MKSIFRLSLIGVAVGMPLCSNAAAATGSTNGKTAKPIMQYLVDELDYSMQNLATDDGTKPYFLSYTVYDEHSASIAASLGAIVSDTDSQERNLNLEVRVGEYKVDNTHQLRGGGPSHVYGSGNIALPLEDEPDSIRHALWVATDENFKAAAKRLTQVKTDLKVKVEEEDKSDDFSKEESHVDYEAPAVYKFDHDRWKDRLRKISMIARDYPQIYQSNVTVGTYAATRNIVNTEGTRLQNAEQRYRITMSAATKADDGMELSQFSDFNASTEDRLPDDKTIEGAFLKVIKQVLALREAPLAEPYIGPAILRNRASGVFFHEIFGHRIEGHRQKDVTEGQTFTKKLGQQILPEFITVVDDPSRAKIEDTDLRGFYRYDDEGVAASNVMLVDKGVLKTFLMSRTPLDKVPHSNGHGRKQPGNAQVSRQGNLIVESTKQVSFDDLRGKLIEECKAQGKPYGLLFEDISGGYTTTSRRGPQSFKVLPIVVYRVYADGRPDELIRGADIVGTPLTSFEKITYTGNDVGVFNGSCGAESGWVPVSASSPSILVSSIEIEKRTRDQSRPPVLPSPLTLN
ncbi:MAG: hypothetical protein HY287_14485 [Planctomycetes bacterium]|nr:hypothetical protein [Planctomycetota bacterium]MBI3835530.1 hypothetical protein [Planctomycetota bacterium]